MQHYWQRKGMLPVAWKNLWSSCFAPLPSLRQTRKLYCGSLSLPNYVLKYLKPASVLCIRRGVNLQVSMLPLLFHTRSLPSAGRLTCFKIEIKSFLLLFYFYMCSIMIVRYDGFISSFLCTCQVSTDVHLDSPSAVRWILFVLDI
jgi:hypothetical protein